MKVTTSEELWAGYVSFTLFSS